MSAHLATAPAESGTDAGTIGNNTANDGRSGRLTAAARPQLLGRVERIGQSEADVVGLQVGPGDLVQLGQTNPVMAEVVAVAGSCATVLP